MTTSIRVLDREPAEAPQPPAVEQPSDLVDAMRDLDEVTEYAQEEEYPIPSEVAQQNARRLLQEMYEMSPRRYEVYPIVDGDIAIDAPDGHGQSVIVFCGCDGSAMCLVNVKSGTRRATYDSANTLPNKFLTEALAELDGIQR